MGLNDYIKELRNEIDGHTRESSSHPMSVHRVVAESISMGVCWYWLCRSKHFPPLPVMPPSLKLFQLCYKYHQAINLMLLLKCFYCYLKNLS